MLSQGYSCLLLFPQEVRHPETGNCQVTGEYMTVSLNPYLSRLVINAIRRVLRMPPNILLLSII